MHYARINESFWRFSWSSLSLANGNSRWAAQPVGVLEFTTKNYLQKKSTHANVCRFFHCIPLQTVRKLCLQQSRSKTIFFVFYVFFYPKKQALLAAIEL